MPLSASATPPTLRRKTPDLGGHYLVFSVPILSLLAVVIMAALMPGLGTSEEISKVIELGWQDAGMAGREVET